MTPSEHTSSLTVNCCGPVGFPSASGINPLTSPLIKTPWGIFLNARLDAAHIIAFTPNQPVPNWFHGLFTSRQGYFSQLSLTLLVNYRSRVVFRIGSICLPHSHAISNACYSLTVTWSYHVRLRDFHPLWMCHSRQLHLP